MPLSPRKPSSLRSRTPKRVALIVETSNAYARGLLQGIFGYVKEHAPWFFHRVEQGRGDDPPAWLSHWEGDGIIARIETPRVAEAVVSAGLPAVDVSAGRFVPHLPWVETDDRQIAILAADHLRERGFKSFGYCGEDRFQWSRWRGEAFAAALRASGLPCAEFSAPAETEIAAQIRGIASWLRTLPKPVGILAGYDVKGLQVLDACRVAGLHVPDEVAVLGVDNDELLCELASPALSSVIPDPRRAGYEAAARLDRLMRGERVHPLELRIPPVGIRRRQSTDVLAIDDALIVKAVRYIREHACDPILVDDVVRMAALSRRVFEARFRRCLGRTPHEEILRVRMERVKQLLAETDLTVQGIAERTGFPHEEYLSVAFKREVGVPPGVYRSGQRAGSSPFAAGGSG
ncbi:MAG TPA: DNA-binding transcriptional regulator [Opitutaceae bacterium]|nr:DNA-binding transcriptional regulator [Opitutaceae bacterium]